MFIDDLTAALLRAMKDFGVSSSNVSRIEVDADERKKRAHVNIVVENKRGINLWAAIVKCAPYLVIFAFGCVALWLMLGMPGYRITKVSTYAEEQSCIVTNAIGEAIKIVQDAKGCATNRWE